MALSMTPSLLVSKPPQLALVAFAMFQVFPLLKICGLVVIAIAHYISLTPPLPPPGPQDRIYKGQLFEILNPVLRNFSKVRLQISYCWFSYLTASPALRLRYCSR